jgi:hypothetical protein
MTDYNVITERERGIWEGMCVGLILGVVLTLWIVFGGA